MDYASFNPDYDSLKLTLWISGSIIALLLAVVAYFLRKQIEVSETLAIAVNNLTTTVKLIEKEQSERDPKTEARLNSHSESLGKVAERINRAENRLTRIESICRYHPHKEEG